MWNSPQNEQLTVEFYGYIRDFSQEAKNKKRIRSREYMQENDHDFIDEYPNIRYNLKAIAPNRDRKGGVFCEKNISTEQKETPNNSWLQSPYENSRRT